MSREITVVLPDGYEDATHLIVISEDEISPVQGTPSPNRTRYATVLRVLEEGTALVEEIGGGPLGEVVREAGRTVRMDQARPKAPEPDLSEFRVTITGRTKTSRDEWEYTVRALDASRARHQGREMAIADGCVLLTTTEAVRL